MKHILVYELAALFLVACNPTYPIDGGKFFGMKGKVKSVTLTTYDYDGEERFGEPVLGEMESMMITEFNKHGGITKNICYDGNGTILTEQTTEYKGKHLNISTFKNESDGEITRTKIEIGKGYYKNIDCDDESQVTTISEDESDKYHLYLRDQDGILWSEEFYNENNDVLLRKFYDTEGKLSLIETNEYDEQNLLIAHDENHPNYPILNENVHYTYLKFDKQGNWTKRIAQENRFLTATIEIREIVYW